MLYSNGSQTSSGDLIIADCIGGPLNELIRCAIAANDENKEVGTVLNLFHECCIFYQFSFIFYFCSPVQWTTRMEVSDHFGGPRTPLRGPLVYSIHSRFVSKVQQYR
jgi:hypothetical protein